MEKPLFLNKCYTVKPVCPGNTLSIFIADFIPLRKKLTSCYLCTKHGILPKNKCTNCKLFLTFPYTFIILFAKKGFVIPPPTMFSDKNFNFFKSMINLMCDDKKSKIMAHVYMKYRYFIRSDFRGGSLTNARSGKKSYIRNKILGSCSNGARLTLTIDSSFKPSEISIPNKIYKLLDFSSTLVMINRSPSITSRCLYVVDVKPHFGNNDTIIINPFVLEGLHADQDGDELNLIFLQYENEIPSPKMKNAISELKRMSWDVGVRHDVFYNTRYVFSQYQRTLLSIYDEALKRHSTFWNSIKCDNINKKAEIVMNLGCSTHRKEVDEFINLLSEIINYNEPFKNCNDDNLKCFRNDHLLTIDDAICDSNFIENHIVNSGAKGSKFHIDVYKKSIYSPNFDEWYDKAIENYNQSIKTSSNMSTVGARQFVLMYEFNSVFLKHGSIYKNDNVLFKDFLDSDFGSWISLNHYSVHHTFNMIEQL